MARARAPAALIGAARPLLGGAVAALVVASLVVVHRTGRELPLLEAFERRTLDLRFRLRGPVAPTGDVVVVAFDDETLRRAPELYERRAGWARVIDAIHAAGPRVIGVDALFSGDETLLSRPLTAELARHVAAREAGDVGPAEALLDRVAAETHGDAALARALAAAGDVVLALHLGAGGAGEAVAPAAIARGKFGQVVPGPWAPPTATAAHASIDALDRAARALGYVTVYEDEGQSLRSVALATAWRDGVYAPLAVQMLAVARGVGRAGLAYLGGEHAIEIGAQRVALTPSGEVWLNLRGPAGTFPTYAAVDVVEGRVPAERLRGRLVIVGMTQLGRDQTRTSFGAGVPGVEVHATLLDNLVRGDVLTRASFRADALAALVLGLLVAVLFWPPLALPVWARSAGALALVVAYAWLAHRLFCDRQLWIGAIAPAASAGVAALVALTLGYSREDVERRRLRRAFAHYLPDGVIDELLADPKALSLGGDRRRLTVLFSDIRGFTSIAERLDPEQLVRLLNTYLTPMARAVGDEGGLVDKFIGDALMAFFGAPVAHPDHAARALGAALRMHEALATLRPELAALGVELDIGVGVNTGEMAIGNMGSADRFNYTVMGDAVNLASRLEGLTKTYGVFCIVGQDAREAAPGLEYRELDLVQVKGKAEPTRIFELLGGPQRRIARYAELDAWRAGVAAFRAGRFAEAREALAGFVAANPGDVAAGLYLARLEVLGSSPPSGWRGVHVFDHK